MTYKIQLRRDTTANWASENPILSSGEHGIVTDSNNQFKIGDGATAWNALAFQVDADLQAEVNLNTAKVSADGSVETHSDISAVGSGSIISTAERTKLANMSMNDLADVDLNSVDFGDSLIYNNITSKFENIDLYKPSAVQTISAGGIIVITKQIRQHVRVKSNSGTESLLATLFGVDTSLFTDGMEIVVEPQSATEILLLTESDVNYGHIGNGSLRFKRGDLLTFIYSDSLTRFLLK